MNEFFEQLKDYAGPENVKEKENMSLHTSFRVGGPADYYVTCDHVAVLAQCIALCKRVEEPYFVMGNGSNLLVNDNGYHGTVLRLKEDVNSIQFKVVGEGEEAYVLATSSAGNSLSKIGTAAGKLGYAGMEFATGIPGSLGGALAMNAGAYGGEMKDIVTEVVVLTPDGSVKTVSYESLEPSYRNSRLLREGIIAIAATMKLSLRTPEEVGAKLKELMDARRSKQPLDYPSAGSTFKRPEGHFAGKLIQDAGLSGYRVGGAMVSEKHNGFVINYDHATAEDILGVITGVQKKVYEKFRISLEMEVKMLGF